MCVHARYKGAWLSLSVSPCMRVQERVSGVALPASLSLSLSLPVSLLLHCRREISVAGWLGEIRCEQRITCSIWPGSGATARREGSTVMYRAVCQPDGVHSGGPLSACQQIHIFHSAGVVGALCMSACVHLRGRWRGERACFGTGEDFIGGSRVRQVVFNLHLV